jgi:hypothetical protein
MITSIKKAPKFQLGKVFVTKAVQGQVSPIDALRALSRHWQGDWGEVCPEDAKANDQALADGMRLLSAYQSREGVKFWIITEADRSSTTILLPEDY